MSPGQSPVGLVTGLPRTAGGGPARPARRPGPVRAATLESLRDKGLLLQAGLTPLLVLLAGALVGGGAHLLPTAVALTALVLGLPGTAGRVVRWRGRGTLALLLGAGGLRRPGRARRLALVLVPSRLLLTVPAAVVAVAGCALTGTLDVGARTTATGVLSGALGLVVVAVLGSATCTTLGVLAGCLLRPREARLVLWPAAVVVALGGVLVPLPVLPDPAAAVLRWIPPAVMAEGLREGLTSGAGPRGVTVAVLAAAFSAAAGALVVVCTREKRTLLR
ncbi:hypothetical protein [Kineococcus sp. SYSU DK003]|uniref:hypothetical protein n=1 Tax=Kineococcus sp. SYSU DK003 TaxID=3383124 RepID=UPI003D7E4CD0